MQTGSPFEETFRDVERLIFKVVSHFHSRVGGEWEDLVGDANLIFCRVYRSFRPDKGKFNKRVAYCVWWGLVDTLKRRKRQAHVTPSERIDEAPAPVLEDFELSGDARSIIEVALKRKDRARTVDALLEAGWPASRILTGVTEVQKVLAKGDL